MDERPMAQVHASVHEPLLGTRVSIRLRATNPAAAAVAERHIVAEIERLEAVLSAYRPDSGWSRWRSGEVEHPGSEVTALLTLAAHWHVQSGGAFHPSAGLLRERWLRAVAEQIEPSRAEMAELATTLSTLPYVVDDGVVERRGDCSRLDLHAIAKGWIIDRAVSLVVGMPEIGEVLVNAGGDLLHRGPHAITVGIEDPQRPFDNVPPLTRVTVRNAGLASSSGARRPMIVAGTRHNHVLDPRTGWPVEHVLAATAIAPDAATADALATIVGVLPIDEGLRFVETRPDVACHLLASDATQHTSTHWPH